MNRQRNRKTHAVTCEKREVEQKETFKRGQVKMRKENGKLHVKKSGLAAAMCVCSVLVILGGSFFKDLHKKSINEIVDVRGTFLNTVSSAEAPAEQKATNSTTPWDKEDAPREAEAIENVKYVGTAEVTLDKESLSKGMLTVINEKHPDITPDSRNLVSLTAYDSDDFSVYSEDIVLKEDAADALCRMMKDYHKATELNDFVVYGTDDTPTDDYASCCPRKFAESATGYTVDLALISSYGTIAYDGLDDEGWIVQNCHKYGFIVRYPEGKADKTGESYCPWHLRYVGSLHAAIMKDKDMCLEEYVDYMSGFSYDEPFECTLNGSAKVIYSQKASEGGTTVRVPVAGSYEISGDNLGNYIITAKR